MTDTPNSPATDEVSIIVNAPASRCYDLVSDITQMGRISPECTGGRWIGGATAPEVGARFIGTNKRGFVRWFTFNKVVAAEPAKQFAFQTRDTKMVWSYRFDGDGESTTVTESRSAVGPRPALPRFFARFLLGGGEEHEQELREGMRATLERLKAVAESDS